MKDQNEDELWFRDQACQHFGFFKTKAMGLKTLYKCPYTIPVAVRAFFMKDIIKRQSTRALEDLEKREDVFAARFARILLGQVENEQNSKFKNRKIKENLEEYEKSLSSKN